MLKPEEILNYLKNKTYKEHKAKTELNNKNNSLNISTKTLLNNLHIESFPNNCFSHIDNGFYPKEKLINNEINFNINKENGNKINSNILSIKKLNYNQNFFKLFKKKNKINLDTIKKCLNIKKKKFNKGNDFSSFFLLVKSHYYINALNQGIINSFISFYSNAEKFYTNNNNNNYYENILNNIPFKIYNIKYPIFIMKELNNNNPGLSYYESKNLKNRNIYEKCCDIFRIIK